MVHALMEGCEEDRAPSCCLFTQLYLPYTYWAGDRAGSTGRVKTGEGVSIDVATGKPSSLLGGPNRDTAFLEGTLVESCLGLSLEP